MSPTFHLLSYIDVSRFRFKIVNFILCLLSYLDLSDLWRLGRLLILVGNIGFACIVGLGNNRFVGFGLVVGCRFL